MDNKKKYEPLRNLEIKLEKYVKKKFNKKYNIYNLKKEELENLEKEVTDKLKSMKEKGLEETYIYEKYRGEHEEIIDEKRAELSSLSLELDFSDSSECGISEEDFIIFVSNVFKINGEILKECMEETFEIEDYANDVLKNIKLPNSSDMECWKASISSIEKKYNCKINCLNIIGKSSCSLDDFLKLSGVTFNSTGVRGMDDDEFVDFLSIVDFDYSKEFKDTYYDNPKFFDEETLVTFLFRNSEDKEDLEDLSLDLALYIDVWNNSSLSPGAIETLLNKLDAPVIDMLVNAKSCKEILGDLLVLVEKKLEEYDYDICKVIEDLEVKRLVKQLNQKYYIKTTELGDNESLAYVDKDSKKLSNNIQDYLGSGETRRGSM